MSTGTVPGRQWSATVPLFLGFGTLLLLVGVFGVWSVAARLSGAVIAPGIVQVESNRQVVQHAHGGVISAIHVRDGDRVEAGEVLLSLDDTFLQSELEIISGQLLELHARQAQARAERDESPEINFPAPLLELARGDAELREILDTQRRLFAARKLTLEQERAQIAEQITQLRNQIVGLEAQLAATRAQADFVRGDLEPLRQLLERGLTEAPRVNALQREQARLLGEIGRLEAGRAQLLGQIAGQQIQELRLVSNRQEEAVSTLRDIEFQAIELIERQRGARETLARMEIRAPVNGVVHSSQVFAVSSVISAAQPLMYVIPQDEPLVILARVETIHIDQVHLGQTVTLRLSAVDAHQTPELFGHVTRVSADAYENESTGWTFYQVEIAINPGELHRLGEMLLVPGMPVNAQIRTGERSPISYLTKPLRDYFANAFRER